MRKLSYTLALLLASAALSAKAGDGTHTLHLYTTNDVHGHYFDAAYVGDGVQGSLLSVNRYIDARRREFGRDNVILVDSGDFLQGDNATYYYNYVATDKPHVYTLMSAYMGYDAVVVGNHDIEAGPEVYDRMKRELKVPFIAANAIDRSTGKPHFKPYAILHKDGLKVAVIGLTNPCMRNWLGEDKLSDMDFIDLMAGGYTQVLVDKVSELEHPDVVIVATHSGTGRGDGSMAESQGLDLLNSLRGVDVIVCAHDHRPCVYTKGGTSLVNSGSHANNLGHAVITVGTKDGKVVSRSTSPEIVELDIRDTDPRMTRKFSRPYDKVKEFSTREIGSLTMNLSTSEAFTGMCDYLNFVHSVCLECTGADICFAAPLKFNGFVKNGQVIYDDLFTIYPYENQLTVIKMTGAEVQRYLEASYDSWINTVVPSLGTNDVISVSPEHILKIQQLDDPRTGQKGWSFINRSYNFDSASGINYTVCVTMPAGRRVEIHSMADGSAFDPAKTYRVAMTSYRANGGGALLEKAGIPDSEPRVVAREKEIRDLVYDYFKEHGTVTPELVGRPEVIGRWYFTPNPLAETVLHQDMRLLFPHRP